MKIRVLSDLHLECDRPTRIDQVTADLVILAGDIDNQARGVEWASATFAGTSDDPSAWPPVVYVAGNHEYYEGDITTLDAAMANAAQATPNVHFLNNRALVDVEGRWRVLGTTLWTDFKLFGNDPAKLNEICGLARHQMNDFSGKIGLKHPGQRAVRDFTVADSIEMNRQAQEWLGGALRQPFTGMTIVVTHHAPHPLSLAPRYATDPVSAGFVNDMTLWFDLPIDLWVHGHTHTGFDYQVNRTRVVCNPRGYPPRLRYQEKNPENPQFSWDYCVEI